MIGLSQGVAVSKSALLKLRKKAINNGFLISEMK